MEHSAIKKKKKTQTNVVKVIKEEVIKINSSRNTWALGVLKRVSSKVWHLAKNRLTDINS